MSDDGYRPLDHAIEILRGCIAPYSGEQAQKVAVVLKTLKCEVERLEGIIDDVSSESGHALLIDDAEHEAPHLPDWIKSIVAERDGLRERVDLDIDEFRRVIALLDDLRVGITWSELMARAVYREIHAIVERAIAGGRQRVPLIEQRDRAERERDSLKAEIERLRSVSAMRDRALLQFIRGAGNGTEGIGVLLLKDDIGYFAVHWSRGEIERVEDMAAPAAKEKP